MTACQDDDNYISLKMCSDNSDRASLTLRACRKTRTRTKARLDQFRFASDHCQFTLDHFQIAYKKCENATEILLVPPKAGMDLLFWPRRSRRHVWELQSRSRICRRRYHCDSSRQQRKKPLLKWSARDLSYLFTESPHGTLSAFYLPYENADGSSRLSSKSKHSNLASV